MGKILAQRSRPKKKEGIPDQGSKSTTPTQSGRIKPDLTEVIEPNTYIQNEEQNDNSIWHKIKDDEQN